MSSFTLDIRGDENEPEILEELRGACSLRPLVAGACSPVKHRNLFIVFLRQTRFIAIFIFSHPPQNIFISLRLIFC